MKVRKGVRDFFASRTGKIIPVLLIALLIAAASSTVYVYYIGTATGTVKTPDMKLFAGKDSSACTTSWPCATVTVAATFDYAAISFSLFPSVTQTSTTQPSTYYSNLTVIKNVGAVSHTLNNIKLSNFVVTNLGSITVYYCTTQTEFNPDGTLVTPGNCPGSSTITSASSAVQSLAGFPSTLTAGSRGFIELYGYALNTASAGSTVTFNIAFQWV
ncbi:MAG TPA: hypothetical protein VKF39_02425 [Nitrososphaerales archaeon]|nr:hypothetical protein [Nitrososphaerales archaeon]